MPVAPGIQAKLVVGIPGDPFELEADRTAECVMRSPFPVCPDCPERREPDEVKPLRPKAATGGASEASPGVESSFRDFSGRGQPLSESARSYFEPRFGFNFSHVRVHSDNRAAEAARGINARAFTLGNDIIFGVGEYAPEMEKGRNLIAHELVHVVQQTESVRVSPKTDPAFLVGGGIYEKAADFPETVFFEFDSAAVVGSEDDKIIKFVDTNPANSNKTQPFDLFGFTSEEGSDAYNQILSERRMTAVSQRMSAHGHAALRRNINEFYKGEYRLDYKRMRKVEIRRQGEVSSEPNCALTPIVPCGPIFGMAYTLALSMLITALARMTEAIIPFSPNRPWVMSAVAALFKREANFWTVYVNLFKMFLQMLDQPAHHECHNACDSKCQTASAYMPGNASGPGSQLTLCPAFRKKALQTAAEILIHEAGHVTPGLETEDFAYEKERGFAFLEESECLKNTDCYLLIVRELNHPGAVLPSLGRERDVIDPAPAIADPQRRDLRRVMAYLEKWLMKSSSEVSVVYDTLRNVRQCSPSPSWSCPTVNVYYKETMIHLADLFGLHRPDILPDENDQVATAGIFHRLIRLVRFLYDKNIAINKNDTDGTYFAPGPAEPLIVTMAFLFSGQPSMLSVLIERIVEAATDIVSGHKPKYVDLINWISVHASLLRP